MILFFVEFCASSLGLGVMGLFHVSSVEFR